METGAPWECCLAAEAIFYVMKGYLKISVSGLSCSQFEKRLTLRQSWNMNCKMSYQKKIVCRMCFSEGAEKKRKEKRSRNTNIHICNFLSSQLSVPLAMTTLHICIHIYDSAKAILCFAY